LHKLQEEVILNQAGRVCRKKRQSRVEFRDRDQAVGVRHRPTDTPCWTFKSFFAHHRGLDERNRVTVYGQGADIEEPGVFTRRCPSLGISLSIFSRGVRHSSSTRVPPHPMLVPYAPSLHVLRTGSGGRRRSFPYSSDFSATGDETPASPR
jgi:hypothetical protein